MIVAFIETLDRVALFYFSYCCLDPKAENVSLLSHNIYCFIINNKRSRKFQETESERKACAVETVIAGHWAFYWAFPSPSSPSSSPSLASSSGLSDCCCHAYAHAVFA